MKILFLDVDGVLNRNGRSLGPIEHDKVARLHKILKETDCKVVLSSTWRKYEDLVNKLKSEADIPIYGSTPDCSNRPRNYEIRYWLSQNQHLVRKYAIIDDNVDAGDHYQVKPNFFLTDGYVGLTDQIQQAIIFHLNG